MCVCLSVCCTLVLLFVCLSICSWPSNLVHLKPTREVDVRHTRSAASRVARCTARTSRLSRARKISQNSDPIRESRGESQHDIIPIVA